MTKLSTFIQDIAIDQVDGAYEQKLSRLLNLICFYGFFTAIFQFFIYLKYDFITSISHLTWGVIVLACLALRRRMGYKMTRNIIFFFIVSIAGYASARLGNETIGHLPVVTAYVAYFIFYDVKKEWLTILVYCIFTAAIILIIDSNLFKVVSVPASEVPLMRGVTIVGTLIFVSVEIILLVNLSALSENSISKKLSTKNDELLELNKEKTVLLQEVHHRVKNNFQIISSLLNLQANELDNDDVNFAFQQAISRINAVSQLHEQIYQSNLIADVDLKVYLETIANTIISNHSTTTKVNLHISDITLKLENNTILPLALIFNELLTNSMKHAFNGVPIGNITIQLQKTNSERFDFIYEDDGKWEEPISDKTFGLELIETLSSQLDGEYKRDINEKGTKYTFSLSL